MGVRRYIASRVLQLTFTLWAFITILFLLFRILPGDPTSMYVADGMTEEQRKAILERLGLDRPLHVQYFDYITDLLQLDLGTSYTYRQPVSEILVTKLFNTIILMAMALISAYLFATLFGSLLGWYRNTRFEKFGIVFTLVARSTPSFWVGLMLLFTFTFTLGWMPSSGLRTAGSVAGADPGLSKFLSLDFAHHLILPFLTGAFVWLATPTLLMRNSMIDVIDSDFIEIKEAEGLPEYIVIYNHAVRNSILPLVTVAAVSVGFAFGGSVVIETVFSWPGMGRTMVRSLFNRDYPIAMGAFFLMGAITIIMNFVADMLYMVLDPRVVYD